MSCRYSARSTATTRSWSPTAPSYYSFFDACTTNVKLWSHVYVKNLGTPVGTVGTFYNIMEWISDEEADRLELEEGMKKYE